MKDLIDVQKFDLFSNRKERGIYLLNLSDKYAREDLMKHFDLTLKQYNAYLFKARKSLGLIKKRAGLKPNYIKTKPTLNLNPEEWNNLDLSKAEISRRTGLSYAKVLYLMSNDLDKIKRKESYKKYRSQNLFVIKDKMKRFKRRGQVNIDFSENDIMKKFGENPICYLTGLPINYEDAKSYQLDHFIPIAKGGTSDLENMRLAHPMANEMKRDYDLEKFLEICRLIVNKYPQN